MRECLGRPLATPRGDLVSEGSWFQAWLFDHALPLWWRLGADHEAGGFHEGLEIGGAPRRAPRRARVQCRQAFTYAFAGSLGWTGPWREAAQHGWSYFNRAYRRPDGLFRTSVDLNGEPMNNAAYLYDQAFALLALAALHRADPTGGPYRAQARNLLRALVALRHPGGGFRETGSHPYQSNAHMHLFEAALAWLDLGEVAFQQLAAEIAELAAARFIDAERGFVREFFDSDWRPAPGEDGRLVEPGHQFEWAWLLTRWATRTDDPSWTGRASRLFDAGCAGLCPIRAVTMDELWDDFAPRARSARLWPQTEYVKAAAALGELEHLNAAAAALRRYLHTPLIGSWWDRMDGQGAFERGPAPASSFYHIIQACESLMLASRSALGPHRSISSPDHAGAAPTRSG